MPIIRRKLDPSTVYPEDIQYDPETDKVQRKVNGSWVDAPESDPRTHTTFPPRITSDPACDAAESVKDAFKGQIDQIITAITNASTAFTIAGLILGLFSFGVFAIFISIALTIADGMIGAGASALTAALTDPVYHTFACILSCHMDSQGRINPGELGLIETEITDQIGGLAAVTLIAMLQLAGEGGVNNIASLGSSTGNCSDCGCVNYWCYQFDFTLSDGGWTGPYGTYTPGVGWEGTAAGLGVSIVLDMTISSGHFTHAEMSVVASGTCNVALLANGATALLNFTNVVSETYEWDGAIDITSLELNPSSGATQGAQVTMTAVLFRGTGDNPFGADNCT